MADTNLSTLDKPLNTRTNSNTLVFVDSRAAAARLATAGSGKTRMVSDNPLLANAPVCRESVEDISRFVTQDEATRLGEAAVDILLALDRRLLETGMAERYGAVSRLLNVTMAMKTTVATFLLRGLAMARACREARADAVILGVTDEPRWADVIPFQLSFFGSPHRSLALHGFFGKAGVETVLVPTELPENFNDTAVDSLALRLAVATAPHVMFHLASRLGLNALPRGKTLIYGKRCELLDETLPWLMARGFRLRQSPPPGYAVREVADYSAGPVSAPELEKAVLDWMIGKISDLEAFSAHQTRALARTIFDHLAAGLSILPETRRSVAGWAGELESRGAAAFLTSGIYGPLGVIVHDVLDGHDIPLIDFEHGVTTGIAKTSGRRLGVCEATTSHILLACSDRSKGRFSKSPQRTAKRIEVVGNADQARHLNWRMFQRRLARGRLRLVPGERTVMHVSTLLYGGTARAADDAPWEHEVYAVDRTLIEKVYGEVSSTVLFKAYPVQRYPDEASYEALFSLPSNVRMIGFEDFRYIRAAADVIVTQANSSTIGWCIAGDTPLVHLHSRRMNSLADEELEEEFAAAFFSIDTDRAGWPERLVEILNRDRAAFAEEWAAKGPARRALLESALAGPAGTSGRRAAGIVAEEVRGL